MRTLVRASACAIVAFISVLATASGLSPTTGTKPVSSWAGFWKSVGVDPPPPKGFLKISYDGPIENFTDGKIPDATVRQWVLANRRRGQGDMYAGMNLRDDIANAGVFGPKGLNGTSDQIQYLRQMGVVRTEGPPPDIVAMAVIAVPKQLQLDHPDIGLTDYVVVMLYRLHPEGGTLIFRDGRRQPVKAGQDEWRWQLDTGHFFEHPVLGPLWYQKNGWSCRPDETVLGQLCGRLKRPADTHPTS